MKTNPKNITVSTGQHRISKQTSTLLTQDVKNKVPESKDKSSLSTHLSRIKGQIKELKKVKKTSSRKCEVCKMEYIVTSIPLLADRKVKEFERQHLHNSKRESFIDKVWRWFK